MTIPTIEEILHQLYEALTPDARPRKVARLVSELVGLEVDQSEVLINDALNRLAQLPDIETYGDIRKWRHSEIMRRPPGA